MIPKTIHYCWFGGNPKPKLAEKCLKSWQKFCPDYKIIEWNESNYSITEAPLYVRQAYEAKKWAFVTDYVRLDVVYHHGGIYLDTDVELLKPIDDLLDNKAYFGFEGGTFINTGLGFGAEKNCDILAEIMEQYKDVPYINSEGVCDNTPCPQRNTEVFIKHGLERNDSRQLLDGVLILPTEFLSPKDWKTGNISITLNTYSIHHFSASWYSPEMKKALKDKQRKEKLSHLPSTIGIALLGKENYEKIRSVLKR